MPTLERFFTIRDLVRVVMRRWFTSPPFLPLLVELLVRAASRYWFVGKMTIFLGISITWHWWFSPGDGCGFR
ncbi:MAG: hypothetical protein ACRDHN_17060 [Thermomicrobiales bacterium]